MDELFARSLLVVTGKGGVGKSTVAAALCLAGSRRGLRTIVVEAASRDDISRALSGSDVAEVYTERAASGALHHISIEPCRSTCASSCRSARSQRTFDQMIEMLAPDPATRDETLGNRIYQELSTAAAGSQEFTAVAKLYELDASGRFDVIVLDTPPSRNALDFLEAPNRLTAFFEGRALQVLTAPSGVAALAARGTGLVFSAWRRVTGVDLLADLSSFFRVLSGVIDGFGERADAVARVLGDPATTFLIVTSPEPAPQTEAVFFRQRLREASMPFGGLVVNRVRALALPAPPVDEAALASDFGGDGELAARSIQALRDLRALAERDAASVERLFTRLDDHHPILVPSWRGTSTVWRASSTSSASCSPSRESVRRCWLTVRSEYVGSGAIGASFVRPAGGDDHHPVLGIEQGFVCLVPTDAVVLVAAATDDLDDLSAPGRHSR